MARRYKQMEAVVRNRKISADDRPGDEFEDDLTAPVMRGSDAADYPRDDSRDAPAEVPDQSPDASTAEDGPLEPEPATRNHGQGEFTASVSPEPDAEDHVVEESRENPVNGDSLEDSVDDDPPAAPLAAPDESHAAAPEEDRPLEPGFVLRDRFEIVGLVHTGGMSHVYKAIDRRRHPSGSEQSYVAIKTLRLSALPERDVPAVLEREAAGAQRLSHPNIVNIFDFDMHVEPFYLVMEWLEGESVKELLQRTSGQQLAPEFAWQIIHGVASALEHAHANNVVHADINLSNIFITETKQIKLLDFGVSRCAIDDDGAAGDELIWVTHKYASPEVLSGSVPVFTDDIFALGCVAYRLLSGRHPFAGTSSLRAKKSGLTALPVLGLAEGQWKILRQALAFARADRPTTAAVFLGQQPAWTAEILRRVRDRIQRIRQVPREAWLVAMSVAAVVVAVGLWSLLRTSPTEEPVTVAKPPAAIAEPAVTKAAPAVAELDERLKRAAQAMSSERYLLPEDDNARLLYNQVLAIDPDNPAAAAGLRSISNFYVQQARTALSASNLTEAAAALAIAADTDPGNPAIAIVSELLVARVDAQLASARPATAEGGLPRAAAMPSEGDRDQPADAQEGEVVGEPVTASSDEQQLIEALAQVEEHMAARRLTLPADRNAYALLLELQEQHGNDERLRGSIDRLGEKLLDEAVIASTAGDDAAARRLLGAAESLGLDPAEIERTRQILATNAEPAPDTQPAVAAAPVTPADQQATSTVVEPEAALAATEESAISGAAVDSDAPATDVPPPDQQTASTAVEPETAQAVTEESPTSGAAVDPDASATDVPQQPRYVSLSDLQIEKYVAPVYPLSARRRGLTGNVEMNFRILADGSTDDIEIISSQPGEVFVASARKAVSRWRFAPPGEILSAQVTVRFDEE